jgi:putative oxidoreductase
MLEDYTESRDNYLLYSIFIPEKATFILPHVPTPRKAPIMIDPRTAPYAATLLRVSLGVMFIAHSLLLKYVTYTLPGTAQFFASLGLPPALAYATFWAELVGGVLLVAGVGSRWVALALIPILAGATWTHAGNGWVFSAPNGGWEYPLFLIAASLTQALLGDGRYALASALAARKLQPVPVLSA